MRRPSWWSGWGSTAAARPDGTGRCGCGTRWAVRAAAARAIAAGRAIAEFLRPDRAIERLVFARADTAEIERAAVAGGMVPMFEAGLDAALAGITTIEDVVRTIRAEA